MLCALAKDLCEATSHQPPVLLPRQQEQQLVVVVVALIQQQKTLVEESQVCYPVPCLPFLPLQRYLLLFLLLFW